jgi:phosphoglycerate dehydrogenase-like enzyme
MTGADVQAAVDRLLAQPSHEAAVEVLRAADAGPDSARREALAQLDVYLRLTPEVRSRPIAEAVVALRRVGGLS